MTEQPAHRYVDEVMATFAEQLRLTARNPEVGEGQLRRAILDAANSLEAYQKMLLSLQDQQLSQTKMFGWLALLWFVLAGFNVWRLFS